MDLLSSVFVIQMLSSYLKDKANKLKSKEINTINTLIEKLAKEKDISIRRLNNEFQSIGLNFNKIMADYQYTVRGSTADKIKNKKEKEYVDSLNANLNEQKVIEDKYQDKANKTSTVIRDLEEQNPYEYLKNNSTSKLDRIGGTIGNLISKD